VRLWRYLVEQKITTAVLQIAASALSQRNDSSDQLFEEHHQLATDKSFKGRIFVTAWSALHIRPQLSRFF